jgi:hypothetical protein
MGKVGTAGAVWTHSGACHRTRSTHKDTSAGFDPCLLPNTRPTQPPSHPLLQVSSPEDASNFEATQSNPAKKNSRYVSTGVFKDF